MRQKFFRTIASALVGAAGVMLAMGSRRQASAAGSGSAAPATSLDDLYRKHGHRYGVAPALLKAIARVESSENPAAINPSDPSYGLMQILYQGDPDRPPQNRLPAVADWSTVKTAGELLDPDRNLQIGAQIIRWNIRTYGLDKGVAVYNRWGSRLETSPFTNQPYVDKVLRHYHELGRDGF